jgi:hypothetical protein
MNAKFPTTVLELNDTEAIDLYYALKREIERTIREHWVNHPDSYEKNEARRLHMLEQLSRSVGHDQDVRGQLFNLLTETIKAKANK